MDTHPLNLPDFDVDGSHLSPYNAVVFCQVHPQQMIVDQPQGYITCKLGRYLRQLRNFVACNLVEFLPGVQLCPKVLVVLTGCKTNEY